MGKKYEIILSGIGGQGLITSGSILGEAAVIYENMNATLTSSYGVETRGTFTKSDVIISKDNIYYPEAMEGNIILALAPVAYNRYVTNLSKDSVLIYDNSLITDIKDSKGIQTGYPITKLAIEAGSEKIANIVALGIIVRKTGILSKDSIIQVLKDKYSEKETVQNINIKAFEKGFEAGGDN